MRRPRLDHAAQFRSLPAQLSAGNHEAGIVSDDVQQKRPKNADSRECVHIMHIIRISLCKQRL
jgi:hypothetical protein